MLRTQPLSVCLSLSISIPLSLTLSIPLSLALSIPLNPCHYNLADAAQVRPVETRRWIFGDATRDYSFSDEAREPSASTGTESRVDEASWQRGHDY